MWRGGFSSGYELFGQIFISGSHQENKTPTSGGYLHVSCIKDEGDGAIISGKTLYLYRQLYPSWRAAGNLSRLLQYTYMLVQIITITGRVRLYLNSDCSGFDETDISKKIYVGVFSNSLICLWIPLLVFSIFTKPQSSVISQTFFNYCFH